MLTSSVKLHGLCDALRCVLIVFHVRTQDYGPLLVTKQHKVPPTKSGMVKTFRRVAMAMGYAEEDCQPSRCGALHDTIILQRGGDTILRYLRDVHLEGSEGCLRV